jgi:alpha-amylase/alpha-mannosidase (GH57 family)
MLATPDLGNIGEGERQLLLATCFRSNHTTMLAPFPHTSACTTLPAARGAGRKRLRYLSGAYFSDLVTWYHLAWTGETERRRNPLLAKLMSQGEGYDADDRKQLLASIGELISGLIPRWRALAERGQVELSSTPQHASAVAAAARLSRARESLPDAPLPFTAAYPGGRSRVIAHIDAARISHARRFGAPPVGMWPAEGAVSEDFVKHLAAADCRWIASGEGVLNNSLAASGIDDPRAAYHPWRWSRRRG